jgi:protein tyrosine/serine phosphatase
MAAMALAQVLALGAYAGGGKPALAAPEVTDSMGPVSIPGFAVRNFGVVDGRIYRGRQPKAEQYSQLAVLGVTTVVDLRDDAEGYARRAAEAAGLTYVNIPIDSKGKPTDADVVTFLKTIEAVEARNANGKAYVHCAGGRHRTGSMLAVYRMVRNGWSANRAYDEMEAYDYYSRWGHGGHKEYVFDYFDRMQRDPKSVPVACALPTDGEATDQRAGGGE